MDKKVSLCQVVALIGVLAIVLVLLHVNPAGALPTYQEHKLVSDISGFADNLDPNLQNPWGMSSSATSPFWISDNRTGLATPYNGSGQPFPVGSPLVVTIPSPGGFSGGTPTGQVFNGNSSSFLINGNPARFIFATEDGMITAWNGGTQAVTVVNNSGSGAVYKGLAISNAGDFLYAANFHAGTIDVFNSTFGQALLAGSFTDPNIPSGYAPFNIQNLGGKLYVTYALQDAAKHDDVPGPGHGFVDVFDLNGTLLMRLISNGYLNSPWGLAFAPGGFGDFSNDLLVGNFGDGEINAFDPTTGTFLGTMLDKNGIPIVNEGLWGLKFGNNGNGGDSDTLYFTAGIPGDGMVEDHGLFGSLKPVSGSTPVPEPTTMLLLGSGLLSLWGARKKFKK